MSSYTLGGVWTHCSLFFPRHADFMSIDEARCRIIVFVTISDGADNHAPMRLWYQRHTATSIVTRMGPNSPFRTHEFMLVGDELTWEYGGGTHVWQRVQSTDQPAWLETRLANQNSRMDAFDTSAHPSE